ncbi:hypothetical protein FRX31_008564 [Thalictrum thalictroides]|uniref:Uncharacterized protein n=1 Tax=Thalictrum thalictroides TaxID=46969 RepID=A0A7J6WWP1_THATH|nr:hypothetical protein FRX31_008564 [Thalictrum thalictroides]
MFSSPNLSPCFSLSRRVKRPSRLSLFSILRHGQYPFHPYHAAANESSTSCKPLLGNWDYSLCLECGGEESLALTLNSNFKSRQVL